MSYGKKIHECAAGKLMENWPTTYFKALKTLENVGYANPHKYFACLSNQHPTQTFLYEHPLNICEKCNEELSIPVYYNSIKTKIKLWCKDKDMCYKMTGHWREKDHWLGDSNAPYFPIKEVWDGTRFSELSWFWDPEKRWLLPTFCTNCAFVISSSEIMQAESNCEGNKEVVCVQCGYLQDIPEIFTHGNPRNLAFLLHWDGFQPFGDPGYHSTGKYCM